jgi:phosphomannomutase
MIVESKIQFGTDGWRGAIAEDYTFANVRRCSQGFADYLAGKGWAGQSVVIGYDQRFGSEHFAAASAEVLAANGFKVWLTDRNTPTPVISYAVPARQAVGAVNITASHNPSADNGFKVRDSHGGAIDPAGLKEIEARIPGSESVRRLPLAEAETQGRVV